MNGKIQNAPHGLVAADVFDRFDRIAMLNVYVGSKEPRGKRAIWNNPFVVDVDLVRDIADFHFDLGFDTTIVCTSSSVEWVSIITSLCVVKQLSWISLRTFAIFHARRGGIDTSARAVDHVLDNDFVETWIALWIR